MPCDHRWPENLMSDCLPVKTTAELYVGALRNNALAGVVFLICSANCTASLSNTLVLICPVIVRQTSSEPLAIMTAKHIAATTFKAAFFRHAQISASVIKGRDPTNQ